MAEEKRGVIVPAEANGHRSGIIPTPDGGAGIVPVSSVLTLTQNGSGGWSGTCDEKHALHTHDWDGVLQFADENKVLIAMLPTSNPIPSENWCPADKIDLYKRFLLTLREKSFTEPKYLGTVVLANKTGTVVLANKTGTVVPANKIGTVVPV